MQNKVKTNWEKVFQESGLAATDIERLRTCFLACDEPVSSAEEAP
jgi:hypothetical protein